MALVVDQRSHFNAKIELDARTPGSISYLVPIAEVCKERACNNAEDVISSIASTTASPAAWIPELAENDDVHVVDVVHGGLLTVRTLQKGYGLQFRS